MKWDGKTRKLRYVLSLSEDDVQVARPQVQRIGKRADNQAGLLSPAGPDSTGITS